MRQFGSHRKALEPSKNGGTPSAKRFNRFVNRPSSGLRTIQAFAKLRSSHFPIKSCIAWSTTSFWSLPSRTRAAMKTIGAITSRRV